MLFMSCEDCIATLAYDADVLRPVVLHDCLYGVTSIAYDASLFHK